jgi:hypothetical protein
MHDGKQRILKPMTDDQIKSDVVLVVRKEKVHKSTPQPMTVKLQTEEHDERSVTSDSVSALPVHDKPVVPVGDKPVDAKPLSGETKIAAARSTLPARVDKGIQTDGCADLGSVHMEARMIDRTFVGAAVCRFVGAAVRMHKGTDGRVRHLCGPGIAPILQGHKKKIHVQRQRAPSRVEKKKVLAPQSKLVWRRKEVPSSMSSPASREGGGGVVGRQDLKMAKTCGDVADLTPPAGEDLPALRTTPFQVGEDDEGISVEPEKDQVKPNFRTPPSSFSLF